MKINEILQAINMASYENKKEVLVKMEDLILVREKIIELKNTIDKKEKKIISQDLKIKDLFCQLLRTETYVRLDRYV